MPGSRKRKARMTKDEVMTAAAVIILLFSAMITWNVYSLLIFLAMMLVLAAWYVRD